MNCPTCRDLKRAYEAERTDYIEACSSAWFHVYSGIAAHKNVEMERARCELEEHRLVCVSDERKIAHPRERGMSVNLKQLVA